MAKRHELGELIDDELEQLASNCKPGCPGPELLEVARGGHNCDTAIARKRKAVDELLADPYDVGELHAQLEGARSLAARLEAQLARIESYVRAELEAPGSERVEVVCRELLEIVTGVDVERGEALAALATEPVVPS